MDVNEEPNKPEKKNPEMKIVGYNLLVLLGYGILSVIPRHGEGLILYAFLILLHFVFCVGAAIYKKTWTWFLSGILVLVIGFSTCVGMVNVV